MLAHAGPYTQAPAPWAPPPAAKGKSIEILGANTAQHCLQAHLLDEIVVHLAPVLLGDGVRFYGGPDLARIDLERTALAKSGQLTDLRFRVAGPAPTVPFNEPSGASDEFVSRPASNEQLPKPIR
jgi:hypothetical protein